MIELVQFAGQPKEIIKMASKTYKATNTSKSTTRTGYSNGSKSVKRTSGTGKGISAVKKGTTTRAANWKSTGTGIKKSTTGTKASATKKGTGTKKSVGTKNFGNATYSQNQKQVNIPTMPITIHGQYIKDLSFETPGPFVTLGNSNEAPQIDLNVEVRANPVQSKQFEVELHITAYAASKGKKVFVCELSYAGLFSIGDVAEQHIAPILLIECPRMLFPFARAIIADITREGGYPPLSLAPVDFADIYRQQLAQLQTQVKAKKA